MAQKKINDKLSGKIVECQPRRRERLRVGELARESQQIDDRLQAFENVLGGLLYLPESEPMRRKAQQAAQMFKDFQFSTSDGFEAEARKVVNMVQQWQAATGYTLQVLGIEPWVTKNKTSSTRVILEAAVMCPPEFARKYIMWYDQG